MCLSNDGVSSVTMYMSCDCFMPCSGPVQFASIQMDILLVVIIMPLTDLPTTGLVMVSVYGLLTTFLLVPYNFLDTFLLFFERMFKEETQW